MAVVLANIASERVDRKDSLRACEIFLRYAPSLLRPRQTPPPRPQAGSQPTNECPQAEMPPCGE
jgi:hypothetical protein